jgi:hypothetical protein
MGGVDKQARVAWNDMVSKSTIENRELREAADLADSVAILKQRIAAADAGAEGVPADIVLADINRRLHREAFVKKSPD